MKNKILAIAVLFSAVFSVKAQAPNGFSYQAVVRNSSGQPVVTQSVALRFTIRETLPTGTVVYQETQSKTTSSSGLVNTVVGNGTVVTGAYPNIAKLASAVLFFQVEVDPAGGTNYIDMGTVQLMSVPFANYANGAGVASTVSSSATINPSQLAVGGAANGQVLKWNGTNWAPAADSSIDNWGSQNVQTDATIKGNGTSASKIGLAQNGATSGQVIKWNGTAWAPADDDNGVWTKSGSNIYNSNTANVGIGTITPAYKLDIQTTTGNADLQVRSNSASSAGRIMATNSSGGILEMTKYGSSAAGTLNGWNLANLGQIGNGTGSMMLTTSDSMGFSTNSNLQLRIRKSGEVVINGNSTSNNTGWLCLKYPSYNSIKPAFEINGPNCWMGFKDGNTINAYLQSTSSVMNIQTFAPDMNLGPLNNSLIALRRKRVGINAVSPAAELHVNGLGNTMPAMIVVNSTNTSSFTSGDSGTLAVYNNYTGSNYNYTITAKSSGSAGYAAFLNAKYCGIRADVGSGTGTGYGGYFITQNSAATNYGVTGYAGGSSTAINYGVYGSASGGSVNYAMYCSGSGVYTGSWTLSSDAQLKKEVVNLESSLDAIMKLRPTSYLYKTDDPKYATMNLEKGIHYGFIAQELEQVYPALIRNNVHIAPQDQTAKVEFKSVNYTEMIPLLVKAIQEQQQQIEELKKQLAEKK